MRPSRPAVRLAVCSTSDEKSVNAVVDRLLGPARKAKFDVILAGDVVSKKKPDPEIYNLALKRLGLRPGECVVVEDNRNGLLAAKGAGMHCVVTTNGYTQDEDFCGGRPRRFGTRRSAERAGGSGRNSEPCRKMKKTILAFGEVLWDILPSCTVLGGAPFNFTYRVNSLGDTGLMASRLGRDDLGRKAFDRIALLGLDTTLLQWDDEAPTGTVQVSFDAAEQPGLRDRSERRLRSDLD